MIKVVPKFDGSNMFSFLCSTKEEMEFIKESYEKVLDRFVEQRFKNTGNLSIKTWADYQEFMKSSVKDVLQMFYGRHFSHTEIGELEVKDAFIIRHELTKGMSFTTETLESLEELVNSMYSICKFSC